ncbi:hypothetical protein ATE49_13885 [Elizabethkingia miricola]|uniref:O-antigen/teichoic acid export membrane protein n=1 Tax=Elizabethkingia miricola TaxID=172045 RepID=A0ABY3NDZ2_ELIMR|nr:MULTISPECIES: oligosaccharide flippase family protein [Elizabethkingia]OBS13151.1 hypothetical protein ATE49_13885 [Elizabethkingia miricola]TYO89748.1 O-antigen/teichoic acid export membrane protein [Elizabethkingia miricola]
MSSQIKKGAIISYATIFINIVIGFLYTPWMIRTIGKSDYGLYILATSFLSYFVMDFGLSQTIARYLAKYKIENKINEIKNLLGLVGKVYLILNFLIIIILIIVYFFSDQIFVKLTQEEIVKFKNIYVIVGFYSLLSFTFLPLDSIFIAYEKFSVLKKLDLLNKLGTVALMIVFLFLGYKLYALVLINALVTIIVISIKLIISYNWLQIRINFSYKDRQLLKELFKFSFWVSVIGIAQRLLVNISPTVLGMVSGTEQIAIFSIGVVIEGYIWTLAHALNGLFLPEISRLEKKDDNKTEITNLMIKVGRIQLLIMGLFFIGLIVLGKDFILLWMGNGFSASYYVILFLILPSIITITQEVAYTYLFVINELKYRAILFLTASIISFIISYYLSSLYGAIGSAIGIFVGVMLCHVIGMNYIYWKKIKLDIPRFYKEVFGRQLFLWIIILLIGFFINKNIRFENLWLSFIFKGVFLSILFILGQWFYGMKGEEKNMIKKLFKGRL